jgi:hypothetical protein
VTFRPTWSWGAALGVLLAAGVVVGACGGGHSAKPLAQESIAVDVKLLRERLVSREAVERAPPGSIDRAFLAYWRSVQLADVERATRAYEAGLREAIGIDLIAMAIRDASATYRTQTPRVDTVKVRGGAGAVRYHAMTQTSGGASTALRMLWRRTPAGWRIRYSSGLDDELRGAAQRRVQDSLDPDARVLDSRAVRAGDRAANLQARYLARLRRAANEGR